MLAALGSTPAAAQSTERLPPEPWPAELGPAFELYYARDFLEVQRVCQQLGGTTHDPRLRREAAAMAAMATMRLPGRADRIEGQARLAELAEEDPSLLTRPECQLAYGIGQTALSATAAALYQLNQAAKTFAAREQTNRLAETLVALAGAWAAHGEWEVPIPEMDVPRPEDRAAADRIRAERITALWQRAAKLPGCETEAAQIELILAQHLLATEDGVTEGATLLEELAGRTQLTETTAQAGLTLAERYEADRRWTDAVRIYARVQAGNLGQLSQQAEQRRRAIQRPQLDLDVPRQVAVGQRVEVQLAVRNLGKVEFEVRRVDLASWLEQRQGRFAQGALPTTGALVAVRELTPTVASEHDWWHADALDEPLTFDAPAGAVVVLAYTRDDAGNPVAAKRLVLAGDLQATVFIGGRDAAIWTTHLGQLAPAADQPEPLARFWMHGSFVPTRPQFTDGMAIFRLPPEARLLRDKRWVCLVQVGQEVALCHGTLPASITSRLKPAVALVVGPPEVRVGEQLHVFGRLLGEPYDAILARPSPAVQLELLDLLDNVLGTIAASVSDAGTFSARMPIVATMMGKQLRVAARLDGQTLKTVLAAPTVRVGALDDAPFNVSCSLPGWLPPGTRAITGEVAAAYPWGTPIAETHAGTGLQALRLPTTDPQREPLYADAIRDTLRTDRQGRVEFVQPLSAFHLPEGPLAVELWAEVIGWDGRKRRDTTEALIGPEPVHLWLGGEAASPRVGEPFHVSVNWCDPTGRAAGRHPTLEVWRDGVRLTQLRLLPVGGSWRSQTWRPTAPGPHELVATLPQSDGDPLTVHKVIQVSAREGAGLQSPVPLRYEARFAQHDHRPHVHVRLEGQWQQPLLLLLETGDPVAARQLPSLDRPTELFIPLPGQTSAEMRLVLATPDGDGVRIVGVTDVRPTNDQALTLALSAGPDQPAPGTSSEIAVTCLRGPSPATDAYLMARLVDVSSSGGVQWSARDDRPDLTWLPGGIQVVSSGTSASQTSGDAVITESHELSPQLAQALFGDQTLWVDGQPAGDGPTTFTVPVPPRPGLYRVVVAAQTPDHAFASQTLDLDTRSGLHLAANVPAQLMLGDRTIAALTITNPEPTAVQTQVTFDGGPGLHSEEWRSVDQSVRLERSGDGASLALTLPPAGTVTLHARVEAARSGSGTAVFLVQTEQGQRRATASYHVQADPTPDDHASAEAIRISRKLWLLERERVPQDDPLAEPGVPAGQQPEWVRVRIAPGDRVAPGQLVLVQEEFSLARPLARVHWKQRLPGNCHTHVRDWLDLRQIGMRHGMRLQELSHDAARLAAQRRHIHEYVIVPVRPGACRFPPPTVSSADAAVRVEVEPAAQRIIVADSN